MVSHPRRLLCALATASVLLTSIAPLTPALVRLDAESINLALRYGMQLQGQGYNTLLGPNWVEGEKGSLLNVYTPFMMLASKTYSDGDWSTRPSDEDVKKARKRHRRILKDFKDPKTPQTIKFSVSMVGSTEEFASEYKARIDGVGRGKEFHLYPTKTIVPKRARFVPNTRTDPYEAINAYYFEFDEVEHMEQLTLVLEAPSKETITFKLKKDEIY